MASSPKEKLNGARQPLFWAGPLLTSIFFTFGYGITNRVLRIPHNLQIDKGAGLLFEKKLFPGPTIKDLEKLASKKTLDIKDPKTQSKQSYSDHKASTETFPHNNIDNIGSKQSKSDVSAIKEESLKTTRSTLISSEPQELPRMNQRFIPSKEDSIFTQAFFYNLQYLSNPSH